MKEGPYLPRVASCVDADSLLPHPERNTCGLSMGTAVFHGITTHLQLFGLSLRKILFYFFILLRSFFRREGMEWRGIVTGDRLLCLHVVRTRCHEAP